MTKEHFIALADALRSSKPESFDDDQCHAQWNADVLALADFCAKQNPKFDRALWLVYVSL